MSKRGQGTQGKSADVFHLTEKQWLAMVKNLNLADVKLVSESCFLKVSQEQWESVTHIRDAMAYLGFDPRKIVKEFLTKAESGAKAKDDAPRVIRTPNGRSFEMYEKNDAATDLLFFITTFLERGNNISKILLKCDKEMGDLLRRKAAAYGIVMERKQSSTILGTSSLTLARLSQAFPVATAFIIIDHKVAGKVKPKSSVGVEELPLIMQHTIFPSLIPSEDEEVTESLKKIALALNIDTSMLLATPRDKRKLESKDVDELASQAEQYVTAAMNGCLLDDDIKIAILKKSAILNSAGGLEMTTRACAAAAEKFLSKGTKTYCSLCIQTTIIYGWFF